MPDTQDRQPESPAPLSGVRVLEIGAYMAAPFGTMQLADLGADVIKIENPVGGDPVRGTGPHLDGHSSPFARLNRNKRSVALDLKSPDGLAAVRELIGTADVLVQNLRPGVMDRLGLGYQQVSELNPRLIYVSVSGWGQDGPLAERPGLDIMAQARGGLMSITGPEDGEPAKVGVPICDLTCGLYVALGTVSALRARDQTGVGQHLDVSLYEAGVSYAIWEAGKYFATGEVGVPLGSAHQTSAPYQAIRTSDGWATVGATSPRLWTGFCEALGLTELLEDPGYEDTGDRYARRAELIPAIEAVTTGMTTDEVLTALDAAGVPCAPINRYDDVFTDDHLRSRDFFWQAEHPVLGEVEQLGSPMRLGGTPPRRGNAGPLLGADTTDMLRELGLSQSAIDRLIAEGAAGAPG